MAQRILVGMDGHPSSRKALDWAVRHAAAGAELLLLLVVEPPGTSSAAKARMAAELEAAQRLGQRCVDHVAAIAPTVAVSVVVDVGDVLEKTEAHSRDVALVAVGTNERRSIRGSRAVRIAATSQAPVVVVPNVELAGRRGVVVGVDGSDASERAIAFAAAEADRFREPLIAVTTWHVPAEFGSEFMRMDDLAVVLAEEAEEACGLSLAGLSERYPDLVLQREVVRGDPVEALGDLGENAQLVVVGSRGLGPIRRMLLGSVSHALLLHANAPLAVVR